MTHISRRPAHIALQLTPPVLMGLKICIRNISMYHDQTHNQNGRRVEKDLTVKMPIIAG